jgi:hypothetical protein
MALADVWSTDAAQSPAFGVLSCESQPGATMLL